MSATKRILKSTDAKHTISSHYIDFDFTLAKYSKNTGVQMQARD